MTYDEKHNFLNKLSDFYCLAVNLRAATTTEEKMSVMDALFALRRDLGDLILATETTPDL